MRTVETLLPEHPTTISQLATAEEARRRMRTDRTDGLAVVDDRAHLVGIVTATDLLGTDDLARTVTSVMTAEVLTASPHTAVADAAKTMRTHEIHHVVVTDRSGEVVGVISSFDLLDVIVPVEPAPPSGPTGHRARPGDVVVVRGKAIDQHVRRGLITEVRGADGHPPFVVRWLDDAHAEPHDVLYFPGSDADIEPSAAG